MVKPYVLDSGSGDSLTELPEAANGQARKNENMQCAGTASYEDIP